MQEKTIAKLKSTIAQQQRAIEQTGDPNAESERAGAIEWRAGDRCKSVIFRSCVATCHAEATPRRARSARVVHPAIAKATADKQDDGYIFSGALSSSETPAANYYEKL